MPEGTVYRFSSVSNWVSPAGAKVLDRHECGILYWGDQPLTWGGEPLRWGDDASSSTYSKRDSLRRIVRDQKRLLPTAPLATRTQSTEGSLPSWAFDSYVFGFLNDPSPREWKNNSEFPGIRLKLLRYVAGDDKKLVLLRFPLESGDEAFVVDRAWFERQGQQDMYPLSRVPVSEYKGGYSLPEVIVSHPVELSRVEAIGGFSLDVI